MFDRRIVDDGRRHFFGLVVFRDFNDHPVAHRRWIAYIGVTFVLIFDLLAEEDGGDGSLRRFDLDMFPIDCGYYAQDVKFRPRGHCGGCSQPDAQGQASHFQHVIVFPHCRIYRLMVVSVTAPCHCLRR